MWFDNSDESLEQRIINACNEYYCKERFGNNKQHPNTVMVNIETLLETSGSSLRNIDKHIGKLEESTNVSIQIDKTIIKNHFFVGVTKKDNVKQQSKND